MYEEFFGLRARPFSITPSVDLFFHSSAHRRALACLSDQVLAGAPLVVLIGNIGAGKTTVLQALLRDLPDGFAPAIVVSTQLDEIELTRSMLLAFGATATGESQEDVRAALRYHLEGLRSRGQHGVLVVDEAQNFPAATLRYLLQLVELGIGNEEASLQAIISGQPGLEPLLLEAVGERAGRELPLCRLGPLNMMDTGSYVRHRLRAVGTTGGPTFAEDALDLVRVATGGLPRLVNRLCDRVLVSAFLDRTRDIDLPRVARVAAELRDELDESDAPFPPFGEHEPAYAPPTSLSVESPPRDVSTGADPVAASSEAARDDPAPHTDAGNPVPSREERAELPSSDAGSGRRQLRWAAAAAAGLVAVSVGWIVYIQSSPRDMSGLGATAPAHVGTPAIRTDAAEGRRSSESNAPAAERPVRAFRPEGQSPPGLARSSGVQEPARRSSQPLDARTALGLAPSPQPVTAPPPATPAAAAPMTPRVGAPTTPPVAAPVAPATTLHAPPSCSKAAKTLGLCS